MTENWTALPTEHFIKSGWYAVKEGELRYTAFKSELSGGWWVIKKNPGKEPGMCDPTHYDPESFKPIEPIGVFFPP